MGRSSSGEASCGADGWVTRHPRLSRFGKKELLLTVSDPLSLSLSHSGKKTLEVVFFSLCL